VPGRAGRPPRAYPCGVLRLLADAGPLPPFGPWTVLTAARPAPVPLLVVAAVGGLYVWGLLRLRAAGTPWPVGRSVSFLGLGLGTFALATLSGLAAYDEELFGVHMVQHMTLSMVTSVFLALGAPVTLALRTLPARPRGVLLALLHSRPVALLTFPFLPWVLFVGTPFALYFSGWYPATLDNPALHELMHVHFLLVGCLFFWPLLGLDPVPGKVGHPMRMLIVAATLPFHAFLGVAVMSVGNQGQGLIAADHYAPLRGLAGAVFQQQVGGGLLWASGDIVGLLFVFTLLVQWMRASEREAAREDRRLDRLEDLEAREAAAAAGS
jgi:cytochrome c oxidase assembly factor CtaG